MTRWVAGRRRSPAAEPGKVVTGLKFYAPVEGVAEAALTYEQTGDTLTVTWSLDQEMGFVDKVFMVFMDFDAMIGDAYDKGLGMLKSLAEKAAALRIAEEKRTAGEAEEKRRAEEAAAAEAEADGGEEDAEASDEQDAPPAE